MTKPNLEAIKELQNAQASQKENSVEGSSFAEYCGRCGYGDCICHDKVRARAFRNGQTEARRFNVLGFILFILAAALAAKYLHII